MTEKIKTSLWLTKKLKEKLRKVANKQKRSMSNLNELILEEHLQKEK